ncbi:hypothetical protein M8J77_023221 [Diaphorina citri]|nr:hypothetical protein M8J77_023221 [Diaphorina citri]
MNSVSSTFTIFTMCLVSLAFMKYGRPLPQAQFDILCSFTIGKSDNATFPNPNILCKNGTDHDAYCNDISYYLGFVYNQCQGLELEHKFYFACAITNNSKAKTGNDKDFFYITSTGLDTKIMNTKQSCANHFKVMVGKSN